MSVQIYFHVKENIHSANMRLSIIDDRTNIIHYFCYTEDELWNLWCNILNQAEDATSMDENENTSFEFNYKFQKYSLEPRIWIPLYNKIEVWAYKWIKEQLVNGESIETPEL